MNSMSLFKLIVAPYGKRLSSRRATRLPDVIRIGVLNRATIYRRVAEGRPPPPPHLGEHTVPARRGICRS